VREHRRRKHADDAENAAQEAAEEAAEDANEETAEDIEGEDDQNADDENAAAADTDEEADKTENDENVDEEAANVWEVSSLYAHGGPASVTGPAADWGGVSSWLRPLRSRPRCRAWTARAWPSMVSR
jgi:hypothetical protein